MCAPPLALLDVIFAGKGTKVQSSPSPRAGVAASGSFVLAGPFGPLSLCRPCAAPMPSHRVPFEKGLFCVFPFIVK